MPVKKYRAKTIQDAVENIKAEMGPDAMILSTRRIPKNVRDPYSQSMFEVTAAPVDEVQAGKIASQSPKDTALVPEKVDTTSKKPSIDAQTRQESGHDRLGPHDPVLTDPSAPLQTIAAELVSIKDMLYAMNLSAEQPDMQQLRPECLGLYAKLVKSGISEERVKEFMRKAGAYGSDSGRSAANVVTRVLKGLLNAVEVRNPFESETYRPHLAAFVGPTGVGKTTTIAKLGAELSLKHKKKVGFVSIDGYRIAAVEQLKTYAAIMGLPCLPAFNDKDLEPALDQMRDRDIVLIDTAGQSHLDQKRMQELGRHLNGDGRISTHLVLSATTRRTDMREAAQHFNVLNPFTYVFTKIDETRERGGIINQVMDLKMPVSFITNGQNVPDDIVPATKKVLLQILGVV